MKRVLAIILSVMMLTVLLAACGEKDKSTADSATPDQSASTEVKTAETTKVIETTAEGGMIEEDAEGNVVEKDKDSKIVSVTDKSGNPVTVTEYITTHHITVYGEPDNSDSDSSGAKGDNGSAGSGSSSKSEGGNNNNGNNNSGNNDNNGGNNSESSKSGEQTAEGEVATEDVIIPNNDEEYELPII